MAENRPYVEVSGVVGEAQQRNLETMAYAAQLNKYRNLLLGVKVTHKTLIAEVPTKYGGDYFPIGTTISEALAQPGPESFAVAQIFMDPGKVDDADYRRDFITRLIDRSSGWLQGVQFDMYPWHCNEAVQDALRQVREARAGQEQIKVLLQCHGAAMQELGPQASVRKLGELAASGCIDYILFDASGGKGTQLDTEQLSAYLEDAQSNTKLAHVGLGIAGGLDAQMVAEYIPALLAVCPSLSWGAEGRLHPVREDGNRSLDMQRAADYIRTSAAVLGAA